LLGLFATPEFVIEGHRDFGESSSKIGLSDANNDYWTFQESFVPWIFKRQISISFVNTMHSIAQLEPFVQPKH
jgi:hypothetical protein